MCRAFSALVVGGLLTQALAWGCYVTGLWLFIMSEGKRLYALGEKQIPPLRCGMTTTQALLVIRKIWCWRGLCGATLAFDVS